MRKLFLGVVGVVCIGCYQLDLPTAVNKYYEDVVKSRPVGASVLILPDTVVSVGDTLEIYGWVFNQFNQSYPNVSVTGSSPTILGETLPDSVTQGLAKYKSSWVLFFVANTGNLGLDFFRLTIGLPNDTTTYNYTIPIRVAP